MKLTLITTVSHVDLQSGARLWANFVTIDDEADCRFSPYGVRQIRGGTWGGLSVFTTWIPPAAKVEVAPTDGGAWVLMSNDGKDYNLDAGCIIRWDDAELRVSVKDYEQKLHVEHIDVECYPFGEEADERMFPFARGQGYPATEWRPVPGRRTPRTEAKAK